MPLGFIKYVHDYVYFFQYKPKHDPKKDDIWNRRTLNGKKIFKTVGKFVTLRSCA